MRSREPICRGWSDDEVRLRGQRLVRPLLGVAIGDVVGGRCLVFVAERVLKVAVIGDVLDLVEIVPQPLLIKTVVDEMRSTSMAIRTKGVDQVAIGCDVLQAIEGAAALLVKTLPEVMQFPGMGHRTEG